MGDWGPIRAQEVTHKGSAHKGPGVPTKAEGGPQGLGPQSPRGQAPKGGPQGPREAHTRPAHKGLAHKAHKNREEPAYQGCGIASISHICIHT